MVQCGAHVDRPRHLLLRCKRAYLAAFARRMLHKDPKGSSS